MVTFDQPLWWKALNIILSVPDKSPLKSIILRLGGFHTLMSFLGSIGHIMEGSGLQHILEQVYDPCTVKHMFSGKAYARAVRGHFLLSTALHAMLTSSALGIPLPTSEEADATTVVSSEADFQISCNDESSQSLTIIAEVGINLPSDPTPTALYLNEAKHLYDGILKGDFS